MIKYIVIFLLGIGSGYFLFNSTDSQDTKIVEAKPQQILECEKPEKLECEPCEKTVPECPRADGQKDVASKDSFSRDERFKNREFEDRRSSLKKKVELLSEVRQIFESREVSFEEINLAEHHLLESPPIYRSESRLMKEGSELKKLSGSYRGSFYITRGRDKGQVHEINLDINYTFAENSDRGEFSLTLSRGGEVYSKARGDGKNNSIRRHKNDKGFLIDVSPSMFLQFFTDSLKQANVYIDGKFVGMAFLKKAE